MKSIYSERVWLNEKLQAATIQINGNKIINITKGERLKSAINFGHLVIMPGVIDAHVHINEPG